MAAARALCTKLVRRRPGPHLLQLALHVLLLLRLAEHHLHPPQAEGLLSPRAVQLGRQHLHMHAAVCVAPLLAHDLQRDNQ